MSHHRSTSRVLRLRVGERAFLMSAMLTAFFWLLILALFQIGDGFAATKSVSDNDIMGDRAVMRAVMADYLRLQQEIRDWARYEGVDVSFGPIKIDIGGRTRSGEPALGAPGARAAGASCTVTLSASVAGQSVTVSATASTCAEAYEEAKQALKKALEDLRDLVRQITG